MHAEHLTRESQLAVEAFFLDGQSRNLSPRTLKFYRDQLNWFFAYLGEQGCHDLNAVTPSTVRSYLVYGQEKGWQAASQHAAARALRAFFNFCVADGWSEQSPMARVRMPKVGEKIRQPFTPEEVQRMLQACPSQRSRALLLCLLDSGCRASEFLAWNVADVNVMTGVVTVHKTKNRHGRTVYLGTLARKELLKLFREQSMEPGEPIWRSHNTDERLGISGLQIMLRKIGQTARVKPCNPHRFRRTFAMWSLRNGMNVFALQKIMGHSDLTVLRRYLAIVESDLSDAHGRFGAVDHVLLGRAPAREERPARHR